MKTIKSVNVGSFALYGAVLSAFWNFVFGLYYWIAGWIFGAQAWWIDMNLAALSAPMNANSRLAWLTVNRSPARIQNRTMTRVAKTPVQV